MAMTMVLTSHSSNGIRSGLWKSQSSLAILTETQSERIQPSHPLRHPESSLLVHTLLALQIVRVLMPLLVGPSSFS
jgi:hypothetical protein